jgi:hypothetical protein
MRDYAMRAVILSRFAEAKLAEKIERRLARSLTAIRSLTGNGDRPSRFNF